MNINGKEINENEIDKLLNNVRMKLEIEKPTSKSVIQDIKDIKEETRKVANKLSTNFKEPQIDKIEIEKFEIKKEEINDLETLEKFQGNLNDLLTKLERLQTELEENNKNWYVHFWRKSRKDKRLESLENLIIYISAIKKTEVILNDKIMEAKNRIVSDIIYSYFTPLLDSLYTKIKEDNDRVYSEILEKINEFLKLSSIYTYSVKQGNEIDYNYMEAILDSKNNLTEDSKMENKIEEIKRYPYIFNDNTTEGKKIITGKGKVWKTKNK